MCMVEVHGPIEGILLTYLVCKGGAAHRSSSAALQGPHAKPHSPPTRLRFTLARRNKIRVAVTPPWPFQLLAEAVLGCTHLLP